MRRQSCWVENRVKNRRSCMTLAAFICIIFHFIYVMCYFYISYFYHDLYYHVFFTCYWKCVINYHTINVCFIQTCQRETKVLVGLNKILIDSMSFIFIDSVVSQIKGIIESSILFHWRQIHVSYDEISMRSFWFITLFSRYGWNFIASLVIISCQKGIAEH